jgi:integrase
MARRRRVMPFLQRRDRTWYFRFRLPGPLRSLAGRSELRISLGTRKLAVARKAAERVLPDVYCLKQLAREMSTLAPEHVQKALNMAFARIVAELERTGEPWMRARAAAPFGIAGTAAIDAQRRMFGADARDMLLELKLSTLRRYIETNDFSPGAESARRHLQQIGAPCDEQSPLFRQLAIDLLKFEAMVLEIQKARAGGDFRKEEEFIEYYRGRGYQTEKMVLVPTGPKLSGAWREYAREKTSALPKAQWSEKTADFQEATFKEFLEIVADLRLSEINRETIIQYAQTLQKLPKNRRKLHGDKPIVEVLKLEVPEKDRASGRTLSEKLIRIKAFLDWCRVTKGAPQTDPTERISFHAESQSYAPFTQSDLYALFRSSDYQNNAHGNLWRFWVPLIALYTGARQAEIAQLTVKNVGEEDGVPFISITNFGEGQRVKTKAGIRKVPISSRLIRLGFLEYVEWLRKLGEKSLFPDLRRSEGRPDSSAISRWFNDHYLDSCGVQRREATGRRKVFHSFRHTAITQALASGQSLAHCQQVFGHEKSLLGETATYMGSFPLKTLVPVVESLDFGLDGTSYGESWRAYAQAKK